MEWNVYIEDVNHKKITTFNIFNHHYFNEDIDKLRKKYIGKNNNDIYDDFKKDLMDICLYYFWSKAEYELILCDVIGYDWHCSSDPLYYNKVTNKKISVFDQICLNFDIFANYIWNYEK